MKTNNNAQNPLIKLEKFKAKQDVKGTRSNFDRSFPMRILTINKQDNQITRRRRTYLKGSRLSIERILTNAASSDETHLSLESRRVQIREMPFAALEIGPSNCFTHRLDPLGQLKSNACRRLHKGAVCGAESRPPFYSRDDASIKRLLPLPEQFNSIKTLLPRLCQS